MVTIPGKTTALSTYVRVCLCALVSLAVLSACKPKQDAENRRSSGKGSTAAGGKASKDAKPSKDAKTSKDAAEGAALTVRPMMKVPCRFSLREDPNDPSSPMLEGLVEGESVRCGEIEVPERHERPDGPKIKIHFAETYPKSGPNTTEAPFVVHYGGPSDTGLAVLRDSAALADATNRNVLSISQRGTYYSSPLQAKSCSGDEPRSNPACIRELNAKYDLGAYDSIQTAEDFIAVALAAGHKKVVAYGLSYGSFLMQRLAAAHPDLVEHAIIDSVVPLDGRSMTEGTWYMGAFAKIDLAARAAFEKLCLQVKVYCPARDPVHPEKGPLWTTADDVSKTLVARFNDADASAEKLGRFYSQLVSLAEYHIAPSALLALIAGFGGDHEARVAEFEEVLHKEDPNASFDQIIGSGEASDPLFDSDLVNLVVGCNDVLGRIDRKKAMKVAAKSQSGRRLRADMISASQDGNCPPALEQDDASDGSPFSRPSKRVKSLVLNSVHDAGTLSEDARRTAEQIGTNAIYVEASCTAHGVLSGAVGNEVIAAFINDEIKSADEVLRQVCPAKGLGLDDREALFQPGKKLPRWPRFGR